MSKSTPEITLEARLASIETELSNACRNLSSVEAELTDTRREHSILRRKLRSTCVSGVVLSTGLITIALNPASRAQVGVTLNSLNTRVTTLETKTAYMTVQAASTSGNYSGQVITRFSGCNVQVDNGNSGNTTASATGTGNLIVGFNEFGATLTGSHNLIVGFNNSYSSYGGIVAGYGNSISGMYDMVIGGQLNQAEGSYDVAIGGSRNTVSTGFFNSIFGGTTSTIASTGSYNSIVGGYQDSITGSNNYAVLIGYNGSTSAAGATSAKY